MLVDNIKVTISGMEIEVGKNTTLLEISKMFKNDSKRKPVIAKVNGQYKELMEMANNDDNIEFLDLTDATANRVYLSGLIFLLNYAFNEIYHGENIITVKHSADKALCIETSKKITKEELEKVESKMKSIVDANLPITKMTVLKSEAIEYFNKVKDYKKAKLLEYMTSTYVHLYKMGNMYNYIFSKMPSETACLNEFKLTYLDDDEFVLQFPTIYIYDKIKEYHHHEKLFEVFRQSKEWGKLMQIETASDLNGIVASGHINDLIRISETLMNNKIMDQVKEIKKSGNKVKVILLAGPSSSGKTTSCSKLAMFLHSFGLIPRMISMDDFFKDRVDTPKKPNGEYDFESLDAIDLKLFNKTIRDLLDGKTVKMPTFDFYAGEKKFKKEMIMGKTDILLIEGIHALNPKLLSDIPRENKYKVYLSPLTAINIDKDNRMSTTDNRLLRRMIRDNRTRGYNVSQTLDLWDDVREGEEKYIFAYQDEADFVFNTSLIYEFCVLKTYVLPLLYSVKPDDPNYSEALRLMKVLNIFLPVPSEAIPADSILREFIGGSCF